jgi:hypothetical protein
MKTDNEEHSMKRIAAGAAALAIAALATPVAIQSPAHADPCFMGKAEYLNWYGGARWGDSLAHVEGTYANCVGSWNYGGQVVGHWNGNSEKERIWPRPDGGNTTITFSLVSGTWRAHDTSSTYNTNVFGGNEFIRDCEWPRNGNGPCTPTA